jgi:signal peptidase I
MWRLLLETRRLTAGDDVAIAAAVRARGGLSRGACPTECDAVGSGSDAAQPRSRWVWPLRIAESTLAALIVIAGWSHGFLTIEGGSMMPVLHPGDVVLYKRVAVSLVRGDLAVFEHGGSLVIHRVAGVERDGSVRTRGDANAAIDLDPVGAEAIKGEVVAVIPLGHALLRVTGGGS